MKGKGERHRDVAHLWADKRVPRFFRKVLDRRWARRFRDVYFALCEIDSDFSEHRYDQNEDKQLRNLTATCTTYSGLDQGMVTRIMQALRAMGLIDYRRGRSKTGQVIGSKLFMGCWIDEETHLQMFRDNLGSLPEKFANSDSKSLIKLYLCKAITLCIKNSIRIEEASFKNSSSSEEEDALLGSKALMSEDRHLPEHPPEVKQRKPLPLSQSSSLRQAVRYDRLLSAPPKPFPTPPTIQQLIDHWDQLGLRHHKPTSRTYFQSVKMLQGFLSGRFFRESSNPNLRGRSFTPEEIAQSIYEFSKAALDPDYWPEGKLKEAFRHLSVGEFLYHPRWDGDMKSSFLRFLEQPAKLLAESVPLIEDKHPEISKQFELFCQKRLGKLSNRDINFCRKAAEKVDKWARRYQMLANLNTVDEVVGPVLTLLREDIAEGKAPFHSGWLVSSRTWGSRLLRAFDISCGGREEEY